MLLRIISFQFLLALLLLISKQSCSLSMARAKASMFSMNSDNPNVQGTIEFIQDPLNSTFVTVNIAVKGVMTQGLHGFHIHNYGDFRSSDGFSSVGLHFVEYCVNPTDASGNPIKSSCYNDNIHGLPPNIIRHPGDMGNIIANTANAGEIVSFFTFGQNKLSLFDSVKSILGRAVTIHMLPDNGTVPYGFAGGPLACGVIHFVPPTLPTITDVTSRANLAIDSEAVASLNSTNGIIRGPVTLSGLFTDTSKFYTKGLISGLSPDTYVLVITQYGCDLTDPSGSTMGIAMRTLASFTVPTTIAGQNVLIDYSVISNAGENYIDYIGRGLQLLNSHTQVVAIGTFGIGNGDPALDNLQIPFNSQTNILLTNIPSNSKVGNDGVQIQSNYLLFMYIILVTFYFFGI